MYVCFAALLGYVGADGLFMGFCLHLSSHYKIVGKRIAALKDFFNQNQLTFNEHSECSEVENQQITETIVDIIKSHVEVLDLTQKVSRVIRFNVFIHFLGAAIVIGMTSINFLLVRKFKQIFWV